MFVARPNLHILKYIAMTFDMLRRFSLYFFFCSEIWYPKLHTSLITRIYSWLMIRISCNRRITIYLKTFRKYFTFDQQNSNLKGNFANINDLKRHGVTRSLAILKITLNVTDLYFMPTQLYNVSIIYIVCKKQTYKLRE